MFQIFDDPPIPRSWFAGHQRLGGEQKKKKRKDDKTSKLGRRRKKKLNFHHIKPACMTSVWLNKQDEQIAWHLSSGILTSR